MGPRPAAGASADAAALPDPPRDPDGRVDVDQLRARLQQVDPVHVLRSAPGSPGSVRWSYVVPTGRYRLVDVGAGTHLEGPGAERRSLPRDPFDAIDALCDRLGLRPDPPRPTEPPFTGGLVGSLAYDLARRIERLPTWARRDREVPELFLDVADIVVGIDHHEEQVIVVRRPLLDDDIETRWAQLGEALRHPVASAPAARSATQRLISSMSRSAYLTSVERALEHIAAGDVFQVNLSHRLTGTWSGDVHELERALSRRSPAPHAAAIDGPVRIASISPETFLVADGRHVRTRPIKGTRPRGDTSSEDRRLAAALEASPKDRAENVMVVDMERNDLGRVCEVGSVHVPDLLALEAHPTVWHLVSSIDGTLRPGIGWGSLLRATFPSGSITGTPKVRAMELIEQLEPVRRGHYCGAIGWLGAGAARLSVGIRTAVLSEGGTVDHAVGAGIVADSDPAAEYAETLAKASAFVTAVTGRPDHRLASDR